jgi:hypothetical protein
MPDTHSEIPVQDSHEDSVAVTGEKTYTQRQVELLGMDGNVPDGVKVIPDEPEVDEVEQPEISEEAVEDVEVTESDPVPEVDTPEEDSPEIEWLDDDQTLRKGKDGIEMKVKIAGEEEWMPVSNVRESYQIKQYAQREAEKVAKAKKELEEQRKAIEDQASVDSFLNRFMTPSETEVPKEEDVFDTDFDEEPEAPAPKKKPKPKSNDEDIDAKVARLVAEELARKDEEKKRAEQLDREVSTAYAMAKDVVSKVYGVDVPDTPDKKVQSTVLRYAETHDLNVGDVVRSPAYLSDALKGYTVTSSKKKKLPAESVPKPPATEKPSNATGDGGVAKKLEKAYDENLQRHRGGMVESTDVDMDTLDIFRKKKALSKGG